MSLASTQQMPKTILNTQVRISSEISVSEKLARGYVSDSEAKPQMSVSGTPLRATDAPEQKDLTGFNSTTLKRSNINWTCSCSDYGEVKGQRWGGGQGEGGMDIRQGASFMAHTG